MSYGVRDWLRAGAKQEAALEEQLNLLARRMRRTRVAVRELREHTAETGRVLSEALLPELTREAVTQAEMWSGVRFDPNPVDACEEDRARIGARLQEIEADPMYVDHERLYGEHGERTLHLEELGNEYAPVKRFMRKARHERLDRLISSGYGSEEYETPWWRMSYYDDWKAGDEVLEKFPAMSTFAQFRAAYAEMHNAKLRLASQVSDLQHELTQAKDLKSEHTRLAVSEGVLEEKHLQNAREAVLTQHLRLPEAGAFADKASPGFRTFMGRLEQAPPHIRRLARRWSGMGAKQLYLERMQELRLEELEQRLSRQLAKLRRKMAKYRRPKKRYTRFSEDEFQRQFRDRSQKYDKFWSKYDRDYDRVYGWDDWDYEYEYYEEEFLWWDVFTDGRGGDYIPEVHQHRLAHPDYAYERRPYDDGDAAAAVVGADYEEDDSSLFDPS